MGEPCVKCVCYRSEVVRLRGELEQARSRIKELECGAHHVIETVARERDKAREERDSEHELALKWHRENMVLAARNVELAREPERLRTGFLEQVHKVRDEACGERDEALAAEQEAGPKEAGE